MYLPQGPNGYEIGLQNMNEWCYTFLRDTSFQVAQIYKDASVGNPVSVAVVKVEILQVRKARKYFVIGYENA
jgi:hypothetical protein